MPGLFVLVFFIKWSALLQFFVFLVVVHRNALLPCPWDGWIWSDLNWALVVSCSPSWLLRAPPTIKIAQQYQSISKQPSKSNVPWTGVPSTSSFVQQDHSISQPQLTLCVNIQTPMFQNYFFPKLKGWWVMIVPGPEESAGTCMCHVLACGVWCVCVFMQEWQLTVKPWPVFLVLFAIKHRLAFRKPGNQCVSATSLTHRIRSHPTHLFIIFLWGLETLQG